MTLNRRVSRDEATIHARVSQFEQERLFQLVQIRAFAEGYLSQIFDEVLSNELLGDDKLPEG